MPVDMNTHVRLY